MTTRLYAIPLRKLAPLASKFFLIGVLPELLGKWYTRPARLNVEEEIDDSDYEAGPWCYCREYIEDSLLMGCDNEECKIVWFHMKCLRLDLKPHIIGSSSCPVSSA